MTFILIEWFEKWDGGLWQIIGSFSNMDEVKTALKSRRKDTKQKIFRAELVTNLESES